VFCKYQSANFLNNNKASELLFTNEVNVPLSSDKSTDTLSNHEDVNSKWFCKASFNVAIVSQKKNVKSSNFEFKHTFNAKNNTWENTTILKNENLLDPDNVFIHNNTVIISVVIDIMQEVNAEGKLFLSSYRFSWKNNSDETTIPIQGIKFVVSKGILSHVSPVFKAMFTKHKHLSLLERYHAKKDDKFKNVNPMEFYNLLNLIYNHLESNPEKISITSDNVLSLLNLSDRFDVELVMKLCEDFLLADDENTVKLIDKFIYVHKFPALIRLKEKLFNELKGKEDLDALQNEPSFDKLSSDMKVLMYQKVFF